MKGRDFNSNRSCLWMDLSCPISRRPFALVAARLGQENWTGEGTGRSFGMDPCRALAEVGRRSRKGASEAEEWPDSQTARSRTPKAPNWNHLSPAAAAAAAVEQKVPPRTILFLVRAGAACCCCCSCSSRSEKSVVLRRRSLGRTTNNEHQRGRRAPMSRPAGIGGAAANYLGLK